MEYSFLSIIPPIIIIALVMFTRKIVLSLGIGIVIAAIIIEQGNIFQAIITILQAIITYFIAMGNGVPEIYMFFLFYYYLEL